MLLFLASLRVSIANGDGIVAMGRMRGRSVFAGKENKMHPRQTRRDFPINPSILEVGSVRSVFINKGMLPHQRVIAWAWVTASSFLSPSLSSSWGGVKLFDKSIVYAYYQITPQNGGSEPKMRVGYRVLEYIAYPAILVSGRPSNQLSAREGYISNLALRN